MKDSINPETMQKTLEDAYALFCRKNKDYGNSFERSIDKYGPVAALVRMADKSNRLDELLLASNTREVSDESVIDTLVDLANYSYMLATYLKEGAKHEAAGATAHTRASRNSNLASARN